MKDPIDRSSNRNCFKCAFQYKRDHGKVLYCVLKNFPILNPEIGCERQMMKGEFKSGNCWTTTEEREAASEAKRLDKLINGTDCQWLTDEEAFAAGLKKPPYGHRR